MLLLVSKYYQYMTFPSEARAYAVQFGLNIAELEKGGAEVEQWKKAAKAYIEGEVAGIVNSVEGEEEEKKTVKDDTHDLVGKLWTDKDPQFQLGGEYATSTGAQ